MQINLFGFIICTRNIHWFDKHVWKILNWNKNIFQSQFYIKWISNKSEASIRQHDFLKGHYRYIKLKKTAFKENTVIIFFVTSSFSLMKCLFVESKSSLKLGKCSWSVSLHFKICFLLKSVEGCLNLMLHLRFVFIKYLSRMSHWGNAPISVLSSVLFLGFNFILGFIISIRR